MQSSLLSTLSWCLVGYIVSIPVARVAMLEIYAPTPLSVASAGLAALIAWFFPPLYAFVLLLAAAFGVYFVEIRGPAPASNPATSGKVVIVTGANAGIGAATAEHLALEGAHVILACRTISKAQETKAVIDAKLARAALVANSSSADSSAPVRAGSVTVLDTPLDLCSLASVRAFAKAFLALGCPLHVLICNAGLITNGYQLTKEGIESSFAANHLGHFLLVKLLMPLLAKTAERPVRSSGVMQGAEGTFPAPPALAAMSSLPPIKLEDDVSVPASSPTTTTSANGVQVEPSRIVILSSSLHKTATAAAAAVQATESTYAPFPTYGRCKLANLLHMRRLIQEVQADPALRGKVLINAVHPGNPVTNFTGNVGPVLRVLEAMFLPMMYLWRETPAAGAFCSVYAATSPLAVGGDGCYLVDSAPARCSGEIKDQKAADELWELSERLCREQESKVAATRD